MDEARTRNLIARLVERFDLLNAQRLAMAAVIAEMHPELHEMAEAILSDWKQKTQAEHADLYGALARPGADWVVAIEKMLSASKTTDPGWPIRRGTG